MKDFKLTSKEKFSMIVNNYLEKLYASGINQFNVSILLNVSSRTIRKWETFESCPSGKQFYNLFRLCKERRVL